MAKDNFMCLMYFNQMKIKTTSFATPYFQKNNTDHPSIQILLEPDHGAGVSPCLLHRDFLQF